MTWIVWKSRDLFWSDWGWSIVRDDVKAWRREGRETGGKGEEPGSNEEDDDGRSARVGN